MQLKATVKKQLSPGIHLVTIKDISAKRGANGQPASWIDPADGQPRGALDVIYLGKGGVGIQDSFLLWQSKIKDVTALCQAIEIDNSKGAVAKDDAIGRKLWIAVAEIKCFKPDMTPELDQDGKQISFGKAMKRFWKASKEMPKVEGNPMDNEGVSGGEFLFHQCERKIFRPNVVVVEPKPNIEVLPKQPIESWMANEERKKREEFMNSYPISQQRPVGAHELRMKSRCERLEAMGFKWDGVNYVGENSAALISVNALLNDSDEVFNYNIKMIEEDFKHTINSQINTQWGAGVQQLINNNVTPRQPPFGKIAQPKNQMDEHYRELSAGEHYHELKQQSNSPDKPTRKTPFGK